MNEREAPSTANPLALQHRVDPSCSIRFIQAIRLPTPAGREEPVSVIVSSGVAVSAKSTSKTPGDHVSVFNLAADGGTNNAGLNVVSANTAFSACEVSGHEAGHGTLKISHVNPGPNPASDAASNTWDLSKQVLANLSALGIEHLIAIGGDDTLSYAALFYLFNLERRIPASHLLRRINTEAPSVAEETVPPFLRPMDHRRENRCRPVEPDDSGTARNP